MRSTYTCTLSAAVVKEWLCEDDSAITSLDDLFTFEDGRRVRNIDDWASRRQELLEMIVTIEYGGLPPAPSGVTGEPLHRHQARQLGEDAWLCQYRIGIWFRDGGHDHGAADWCAFLDFMAWQLQGKTPSCRYDENPFPDMEPAFTWSAPHE